jgi:ribosomal protein bL25 (Ctc-form)
LVANPLFYDQTLHHSFYRIISMSNNHFELNATDRSADLQGKGASRRLRKQNLVPAIIYGGGEQPTAISIKINELVKALEFEAFFSHILTINVDGTEHQAVIKDLQRHPAKGFPMHADFQRVVKGQKIHMNVPVHFVGREEAPGTAAGGVLSTLVSDIEVICLGATSATPGGRISIPTGVLGLFLHGGETIFDNGGPVFRLAECTSGKGSK